METPQPNCHVHTHQIAKLELAMFGNSETGRPGLLDEVRGLRSEVKMLITVGRWLVFVITGGALSTFGIFITRVMDAIF